MVFKKGDKAEIILEEGTVERDIQVGEIVTVGDVGEYVEVAFDDEPNLWWEYRLEQLKLVERSQTSLSDTDKVNPSHYKKGEVECIEAIKAATVGKSGFEGYLVGNVIKYLWRYEDKGGEQDIKKGLWYLNKLLDEQKT